MSDFFLNVDQSKPGLTPRVSSLTVDNTVSINGKIQLAKQGLVTQITSLTTPVTSNGGCGRIQTVVATLASAASATFTVNDSSCLSTNFPIVLLIGYGGTFVTNGVPIVLMSNVTNGSFDISVINTGTNALNGALVIEYILV